MYSIFRSTFVDTEIAQLLLTHHVTVTSLNIPTRIDFLLCYNTFKLKIRFEVSTKKRSENSNK